MHIGVQHIQSSVNLANLFTKLLPTSTFEKTADKIEIRRLEDLHKCLNEGEGVSLHYTLFPLIKFSARFLIRQLLWTSKGECYKY